MQLLCHILDKKETCHKFKLLSRCLNTDSTFLEFAIFSRHQRYFSPYRRTDMKLAHSHGDLASLKKKSVLFLLDPLSFSQFWPICLDHAQL